MNLKVGDRVKIFDGSWVFGIRDSNFDTMPFCSKEGPMTILKTGLRVCGDIKNVSSGCFKTACDILLIDDYRNFWFVPSRHVKLSSPTHIITIAGKNIEISDESYKNLKKQLLAD